MEDHLELDIDKIDEAVLALLALGQHDGLRAWKSFDWESLARLHERGYISDPVGKAKSARESQRLLHALFAHPPDQAFPR